MSENHGEKTMQPPISEYAKYLKNLVPVDIQKHFALKPIFKELNSEEEIRNAIIAFRDFLVLFCDGLIKDGHLYAKPKKTNNPTDYPFLHNMTNLLVDIGYYGKLSENGNSLLIVEIPLCSAPKPKISAPALGECLRFLSSLGFSFANLDLNSKKLELPKILPFEVSFPDNPALLLGLKVMSVADMELRESRRYWNDHYLLGLNYRLILAQAPDELMLLRNFLNPLPGKVKEFALDLHDHFTKMGLTCAFSRRSDVHFAYSLVRKSNQNLSEQDIYQKRIWEFSSSMKHGYCLVIRARKTEKYSAVIENFPLPLKAIIKRGYGCDRKLWGERCQGSCQGFRLPLNIELLEMKEEIKVWLDNEVKFSK
ncbi:MAG: hypothetical protein FWG91_12655 [Lachnospiraceae bacterium]|nr:hypothetical protein [Lachnospiraceae bacterium]